MLEQRVPSQRRVRAGYGYLTFGLFFVMSMMMATEQSRLNQYPNTNSDLDELKDLLRQNIAKEETPLAHRQLKAAVPNEDTIAPTKHCFPWDKNTDRWWQAHPAWEPHQENETHTCFRPIPNEERAAFLRDVYSNQYHGQDCSHMKTRHNIGVGYAAAVVRLFALSG